MELYKFSDSSEQIIEGRVILINKPKGWSSFQIVNKIRHKIKKVKKIKKLKVGHAGTLDPLATGLLIVCVGKATKQIYQFQNMTKVYTGIFKFGSTTPSYDLETKPNEKFSYSHLNKKNITEKTKQFIGCIEQKPPVFSAIKIKGKRLYEYARAKEKVEINTRKVEIKKFEITSIKLPSVGFRVECGKGTYIRSLANDFGRSLNSGAYLYMLNRVSIGAYGIENALKIDEFEKLI